MKAIVCTKYGPPEVLQLQEVEKPTPRNNEVCIKIFATAVTSSDCLIRGSTVPLRLWLPMRLVIGFTKPRNHILGMVLAGEVESVGTEVTRFQTGNQVYAFNIRCGTYAEYTCLPENSVLAFKPSTVTYEEAAAVPYGSLLALHFLRKSQIQSGQKVLIYGASGAVGTAAIQLARHFGAEVTGVCSTTNVALVESLGAEKVIDYTKEDFTKAGELYDCIFDAVGKRKSSQLKVQCHQALTPNGKYLSVDDGSPKLHSEDLLFLTELIEAGQIQAVIDRCYPLEQIVEAHRYVDETSPRPASHIPFLSIGLKMLKTLSGQPKTGKMLISGKEHDHDHSREHPQFCTRHPAVVSCPRPSLHESALRPLGLPGCQLECSGHPWAPLKRDDAVRWEVARGADRSISQVGRSRDACLVPFRLIPNCSFQHEQTRLPGWLILRSGRPSLVRFDVWFRYCCQSAKVCIVGGYVEPGETLYEGLHREIA